jgi:hypothetical protein
MTSTSVSGWWFVVRWKKELFFTTDNLYAFTGSKVQGFKVVFSSLDWIWDAYLQEKRQLRQA